ncbi:MAG TPA: hypothetical protein VM142_09000 [Acidimicrobiales bacterium]|nr:hypothetical protein [Acidimicrobiales bacterium]
MTATTKPGPAPADGEPNPTRVKPAVLALLAAALAAVVAFPAIGFACSGQASFTVAPGEGLAGDPVQVVGQSFFAAPVTVTWNGAGGPVVGTAQGPDIDLSVRVPAGAAPGVYYITASSSNGSQTYRASASFRVNSVSTGGGSGTGTTAQPGRSSASTSGPATATDDKAVNASTSGAGGNSTEAAGTQSSPGGSFIPEPSSSSGGPDEATGRATAGSGGVSAPAATAALPVQRSTQASAPTASSPRTDGAVPESSTVQGPNIARLPNGQVVSDDLWAGFNASDGRTAPPGLIGEPSSSAGGASVQLLSGVILVALSIMVMGGALATARAKRQRAAAHP